MQTLIAEDKKTFVLTAEQSMRTLSLYSFIGKSVVVFGDSWGLGTALIKELIHQKALLTLVVRSPGEQLRARRELQNLTDQPVVILVCDTTEKDQVRATLAEVNQLVGFIDVMINNLQNQSALNALCEVLPIFCRQREGRIININSNFTDTMAPLGLQRYNISMTTIHLSALVPADTAAFEILKSVRKHKTEIVISESSLDAKRDSMRLDEFVDSAVVLH